MTPLVEEAIIVVWFNKCFFHDVQQNLKSKNLETKVLLNLHKPPGHPQDLGLLHPNI
jgi:hypothetical protein